MVKAKIILINEYKIIKEHIKDHPAKDGYYLVMPCSRYDKYYLLVFIGEKFNKNCIETYCRKISNHKLTQDQLSFLRSGDDNLKELTEEEFSEMKTPGDCRCGLMFYEGYERFDNSPNTYEIIYGS